MEKQLRSARNALNKVVKNLNRNDIDWTVQFSINSTAPERVNYSAYMGSPATGLQPVTWVCESYDELMDKLKISGKALDQEAVNRAWHEGEIARAKALIKYHQEALGES